MTIDDQLRGIARHADERQRPITVEEVVQRGSVRSGHRGARPDPATTRLLAIAACVVAVLALAVALVPDRTTVATTDRAQVTDCPDTGGALAPPTTPGGQMHPSPTTAAVVAAAALLVVACSDDEPKLLARGDDIEMSGDGGLGGTTLDVDATEEGGEATGEFRVDGIVNTVRCADTGTDGYVVLGAEVTSVPSGFPDVEVGALNALVIREGDPDSVAIFGNDTGETTCEGLLGSIPEGFFADEEQFHDLLGGYDIETG